MQVGKYLLDDHRVLNAGNHFNGAAACTARFIGHVLVPDRFAAVYYCANRLSYRFVDVNIEYPLQSLRPGHRCTAFGGRLVLYLIRHFERVAFAPLCGCHLHTMFAVRGKHTVTNSSGMNVDSFSRPAKRAGIRDDSSKAGEVNPRLGHQGSKIYNNATFLNQTPFQFRVTERIEYT